MVIDLDAVTVRYGDKTALDGVDLEVGPGERVALVGPSGAGKTTLLSVLWGTVEPTTGRAEVLGFDLESRPGRRRLRAHRRRIGTISQQLDLALPLRVVHNVNAGQLGRWSTPAAVWSLVRPRGRHEVAEVLGRVGLEDRLSSPTGALSGGERQRVAVARVLHQGPELVLADEPTSSVDPRLSDQVMGLLCAPNGSAPWTTVVSMHDPELARRHATRLVGLRAGRVVFDAGPDEVSAAALADLYRLER
jgi:phosphonate transport system ATP-binding protein